MEFQLIQFFAGLRSFYNDILDNIVAFRILGATGILLVVFILGSVGYHFIEGMGFFDGFYMTFITITTIGFAELTNLSASGRILTMCLFVMGIGIISYIASQTTQLLFESEIFRKRVHALTIWNILMLGARSRKLGIGQILTKPTSDIHLPASNH